MSDMLKNYAMAEDTETIGRSKVVAAIEALGLSTSTTSKVSITGTLVVVREQGYVTHIFEVVDDA